jgi:hypothetical protein
MDFPNGPLAKQGSEFGGLRVTPVREGFHKEHTLAPRHLDHRHDLAVVGGGGLFTQNMLAVLGAPNRPFAVRVIGKADVNGLHVGIPKHFLVALVSLWNSITGRKLLCRIAASASHRKQGPGLRALKPLGKDARI